MNKTRKCSKFKLKMAVKRLESLVINKCPHLSIISFCCVSMFWERSEDSRLFKLEPTPRTSLSRDGYVRPFLFRSFIVCERHIFYNRQIDIVRCQNYRLFFIINLVCFLTGRLFSKIFRSIKSFVQ